MKFEVEKYMLGQRMIDDDHRELFRILEECFNIYGDKLIVDKYDKIMDVIEELKDYTEYHFNKEEEVMLNAKYNKFFSHKVQHIEFIKKLDEIDFKKIDIDQNEEVRGILNFILKWLEDHILYTDKLFVKFYNTVQV